jgi:hypothetical protein
VLNVHLIAFGSLLLLAGRLGDLIGRQRMFVSGPAVFTVASLMFGIGGGLTRPALASLAMSRATPSDAGLASGLFNTTQRVGAAAQHRARDNRRRRRQLGADLVGAAARRDERPGRARPSHGLQRPRPGVNPGAVPGASSRVLTWAVARGSETDGPDEQLVISVRPRAAIRTETRRPGPVSRR